MTDKHLRVPVSARALELVKQAAKERGYSGAAEFVRALLADAVPELRAEFEGVEWGGNRRGETD